MKPIVFILAIIVAIGFLGLASAPLFTPTANDQPAPRENPSNEPDVEITSQFPGKIVYTTDRSQSFAPYQADCQQRGGEFNECGSICASDAEICAEVCAYTCDLPEDATQAPISVSQPQQNETVTSPLTVTGEARGPWYFEASFPVRLLDEDGNEIAIAPAQAQSDWMTEEFVPFEVTLEFETLGTESGTLVLEKANPSGLPEHNEFIQIPVRFTGE